MKSNEPLFDGPELAARLAVLPGWRASNGWLRREYTTDGWRSSERSTSAVPMRWPATFITSSARPSTAK